jgi:tight adherence protein C
MEPNIGKLTTSLVFLTYLSSLTVGVAVFLLGWYFTTIATADRGDQARWATFETDRRQALRRASTLYRWLEPLVDALAGHYSRRRPVLGQRIERSLSTLTDQPPWIASEWLAVHRLAAWAWSLGPSFLMIWACGSSLPLLLLTIVLGVSTFFTASRHFVVRLEKQAGAIRSQVRFQLPFAIDLLQLMLKAGSSFPEALETLVRQTRRSALANHLAIVLQEIERGISRAQALGYFQVRLGMDEAQELVFALRQGDELGTPLTQVLETQAYQLRNRQAQTIEKAAEQAKVKFAGPSTLIMIACMIAMLAPWVLKVLNDYKEILH